ncbi:transposase domain-containing protein [Streptomyces sp. NPDC088747]|uniref:transposase domain-containing protein n=1 Tax=Streptomyces sp. NPDC088747 TaxID=3365886 RepID=UPI003821206B
MLDGNRCVQRRLRDLPSRVGVYFLLAMCLFPEVGYRLVWPPTQIRPGTDLSVPGLTWSFSCRGGGI